MNVTEAEKQKGSFENCFAISGFINLTIILVS